MLGPASGLCGHPVSAIRFVVGSRDRRFESGSLQRTVRVSDQLDHQQVENRGFPRVRAAGLAARSAETRRYSSRSPAISAFETSDTKLKDLLNLQLFEHWAIENEVKGSTTAGEVEILV